MNQTPENPSTEELMARVRRAVEIPKSANSSLGECWAAEEELVTLAPRLATACEELKAENERLKDPAGGLVDEFLDRMLGELTRIGVDISDCDGDDDPAIIVAGYFAGRIKDAETACESLRSSLDRAHAALGAAKAAIEQWIEWGFDGAHSIGAPALATINETLKP